MVVDGNGLPLGFTLGFTLGSANTAEVTLAPQTLAPQTLAPQTLAPQTLAPQTLAPQTLAPQTLESVRVVTRNGKIKTRPGQLVADRAYDSRAFRRSLRQRGIRVCIPPRRRHPSWKKRRGRPVTCNRQAYKQRFKVERCFAWRGNFRRLLIRWEHHLPIYRAFCLFALALICLNALLK